MLLILMAAFIVGFYVYTLRSARADGLPSREEARAAFTQYRNRSKGSAQRTSSSVARGFGQAFVPHNAVDLRIALAACVAVVVLGFSVGGLLFGSIMVGIVIVCLAPAVVSKIRSTREVRRLMRDADMSSDQPLYVPMEWQDHKPRD